MSETSQPEVDRLARAFGTAGLAVSLVALEGSGVMHENGLFLALGLALLAAVQIGSHYYGRVFGGA